MTDNERKFVVVLNRSFELPRLVSGLGHVTAGLVASLAGRIDELSFVTYKSLDGKEYPFVSDWPFIILRGGGGQMATFVNTLEFRGLPCVTYLDTMLYGGSAVQQSNTAEKKSADLVPLAVATFGEPAVINELTKKFSLWQ
jgi:hypothetical protein